MALSLASAKMDAASFSVVTDNDLLKARLLNGCRLAESGCWEWIGSKRNGYGLFSRNNKTTSAHRVSYEAHHGLIPSGMVVRHSCDNPSCINPNHLLIGTIADNVADREARGRRDVKGEQIGTSKLTEAQVLEIRASSESHTEAGARLGVSKNCIWSIRSGRSWKHLISVPSLSREVTNAR